MSASFVALRYGVGIDPAVAERCRTPTACVMGLQLAMGTAAPLFDIVERKNGELRNPGTNSKVGIDCHVPPVRVRRELELVLAFAARFRAVSSSASTESDVAWGSAWDAVGLVVSLLDAKKFIGATDEADGDANKTGGFATESNALAPLSPGKIRSKIEIVPVDPRQRGQPIPRITFRARADGGGIAKAPAAVPTTTTATASASASAASGDADEADLLALLKDVGHELEAAIDAAAKILTAPDLELEIPEAYAARVMHGLKQALRVEAVRARMPNADRLATALTAAVAGQRRPHHQHAHRSYAYPLTQY